MSTTPAERPRFDVFLSHSAADKPAVEAIGARLRGDGFRPFLDKWNLVPGLPWQAELADALAQSGCVAVFFGAAGPGPWHSEEMQLALNRAVRTHDDYRVIPVLLPGSDPSQVGGFLENRTWVDFRPGVDDAEAYGRLLAGIQGTAPQSASYELPDEPRPYRGLERFESGHHEFFYGRDEDIGRLVDRLRREPFVAVVGASGSGKSSLVRAGLSTETAEHACPGIRGWRRLVVIPGPDPLRAVADQVRHLWEAARPGETGDPVEWVDRQIDRFRQREDGLLTLLGTLFGAEGPPVLLVIDQFEEVFTHRPAARERDASWRERTGCLAANLGAAVDAQPAWLRIVATLRADFITRFVGEDFPALRRLLERRQLWLGPMSEEDLREAIVSPARRRGAFLEKGLVEMILRDMRGHPAALPLLEESLAALWEQRRGPWLTLDAYARTGGVGGALAAKADALYAPLSPDEQRLTRRLLLGLVHLGEGVPDTRRRVPVPDLLGAADRPEQVEALLRRFSSTGGARLLTLSSSEGTVTAELTHEALIHHWFQLRRWLDESRDDLKLQRRLDSAARHWQELGRPDGSLWRPPDLDLLQAFVTRAPDAVTRLQLDFHEASGQAEARRQRERQEQAQQEIEAARQLAAAERQRTDEARAKVLFRRWALAAGVLALAAIGATVLAVSARNEAVSARGVAEQARGVSDRQAHDLLNAQIDRYERIPTAVSWLTTPSRAADGYPFDRTWAGNEYAQLQRQLDAAPPVGTEAVLENWRTLRALLSQWDPRVAPRPVPDPALQAAARGLARSFAAMWRDDTRARAADDPRSARPSASPPAIQDSRPFLDKRRQAYAKDLRVLRSLVDARTLEPPSVRESYREFWKLYWGELLIVEDHDTLRLMIDIGGRLESWLATGRKPLDFDETAGQLITHLEQSLAGARSGRRSRAAP